MAATSSSPKLRKRRNWQWILWLLVLVVGALGVRYALSKRPVKRLAVRAQRVDQGPVRELVSTVGTGRVAPHRELNLRAELAGTVRVLHVRRGTAIHRGDLLLEYDTAELRERLRAAQASVSLGRAQAAQAAASTRLAQSNASRARILAQNGVSPPAEAETLEGQLDVASRASSVAQTAIGTNLANVRMAQTALGKGQLRAPFDGVVLSTGIEEGEVVAPGQPLMSLAELSELHVDAEIDEADLGRLTVGLVAEVALDAFPGQRFPGHLTEIAPSVTRDLRGARSVAIRVELQRDPRLRVGMSAEVDLVVATRENVLRIPPNAVLGRGTDRAVYVVEAGVARRRPIEVGISTWENVEVTKGLQKDEMVIVTLSAAELADGVAVEVRSLEASGR